MLCNPHNAIFPLLSTTCILLCCFSSYAGRKRLHPDDEREVEDMPFLAHPEYSYWTLGYLLSRTGAEKLLASEPLGKILPVDEYLPIMYNKHPRLVMLTSVTVIAYMLGVLAHLLNQRYINVVYSKAVVRNTKLGTMHALGVWELKHCLSE